VLLQQLTCPAIAQSAIFLVQRKMKKEAAMIQPPI
jgi:hypothetical protein